MRPAMMLTALPALALLPACNDAGADKPVQERRTAPGEVLGGEVSDAMLPIDSARSTSPAGARTEPDGPTATAPVPPQPSRERRQTIPGGGEARSGPEPAPTFAPGEIPEDRPVPQ